MLERIVLRPELSAFAKAIGERLAVVVGLEDERFPRPRAVEAREDRLTVVSEYLAGRRLSDIIDCAADHAIVAGLDAALGLLLEILPAVSRLHDAGLAHGALAPGRIMITPAGQIGLLDAIYAEPLERLQLTRKRLWSELRLAFPPTAGSARFDKGADLAHASMVAATLTVGRALQDKDYPEGITVLRQEIHEIASIRGSKSFAEAVDKFFAATLPLAGRRSAPTADEAAIDLRKLVRKELGINTCRTAWLEFLHQVEAADAERTTAEAIERDRRMAAAEAAGRAEADRQQWQDADRAPARSERAAHGRRGEKAEAERAEAARVERERAEQARLETERIERERVEGELAEQRERDRLQAERAEAERRERERLQAERAEAERRERERAEQARLEAEQRERERLEAERRERERLEAERLEWERIEEARLEAERREGERLEAERRERERLEAERLEHERIEQARLEAERRERERLEAERRERERLEAERLERERIERERLEAERRERERLEAERRERERLEAERLEKERIEKARLEAERIERERIEAERRERREAERRERERIEAERREKERAEQARREAERLERERIAKERAEQARLEAERQERERLEKARREAERIEQERAEQARREAERLERERAEQARLEAERQERERAEQARREAERLEQERAEQARREAERLEQERAEQARREAEKRERERAEAERAAKDAREKAERLERVRAEEARRAKEEADRAAREAENEQAEPAARQGPAGSKSGWLIPPNRAASFEPVASDPAPSAPARTYPIYVAPPEPPAWVSDPPAEQTKEEFLAALSAPVPIAGKPAAVPIRLKVEEDRPAPSVRVLENRRPPVEEPAVSANDAYEPFRFPEEKRSIPWKWIAAGVVLAAGAFAVSRGYTPNAAPVVDTVRKVIPRSTPTELPPVAANVGRLIITSQPPGAEVTLDGKPAGQTPLTIDGVKPGRHILAVAGDEGSARRTVRVDAGQALTVDVPLYSGFVAISIPFVVNVSEAGKALGTSENAIILSPGRHTLRLVNKELEYSATETVEIRAGETTRVDLDPKARANINAVPWAEVWIDGQREGETPLANVPIRLGVRDVVFKNPQFPERKQTITITGGAPATISVDFIK
jgi:hypothetical protein